MPNCENCIHAKPYGGPNDNRCSAWSCNYVNKTEALKLWEAHKKGELVWKNQGENKVEFISRDKALMNARPEYLNPNQEKLASYNQGWNNAIEMYCKQIAELPIIEERGEGHWIDHSTVKNIGLVDLQGNEMEIVMKVCSECGYEGWETDYCPSCGAKMRESR